MLPAQIVPDTYFPAICGNGIEYYRYAACFDKSVLILDRREYQNETPFLQDLLEIRYTSSDLSIDDVTHIYYHDYIPSTVPCDKNLYIIIHGYSSRNNKHLVSQFERFEKVYLNHKADIPFYTYLGYPISKFEYLPVPIDPNIANINITESKDRPRDLIYFGRLIETKGIDKILHLLCELPNDTTLTLIGNFSSIEYENRIRNMASNFQGRVDILPAMLPTKEFFDLVAQHKIFILLSTSDCFSISLLDALSLGLECIVEIPLSPFPYTWTENVRFCHDFGDIVNAVKAAIAFPRHPEEIRSFLFSEFTIDNVKQVLKANL